MSGHTPGPWRRLGGMVYGPNGERIAGFEGLGNARLIVAAPDLLAELQGVLAATRIDLSRDDVADDDVIDLRITGKTLKALHDVVGKTKSPVCNCWIEGHYGEAATRCCACPVHGDPRRI